MHIVMLSDWETHGGAAVAASRLADGLCEAGHRVTRIVHFADNQRHAWKSVPMVLPSSVPHQLLKRSLPSPAWELLQRGRVQRMLNERLQALRPDFINIHNLHSADWFPDLLRVCARHASTVCTLHDMWSFTGRCAYSYECRKFLTGCDATCPTPQEYPARRPQLIAGDWQQRRHLLENEARLWAVAPSQWLAQAARAGLWKNRLLEIIPYGLPLDVYQPVDRVLARQALGIDSTGPVILVVAQNLSERRKGGSFLIEALQKLPLRPLSLLTMGIDPLPVPGEGVRVHPLGYVTHDRMKVLAYSAADLLVHPAPVDNLPNVVLEAIACGTPVVGFPIGGMPDMVRAGETGWLAPDLSSQALADVLAQACGELKRGCDLRDSCRVIAEREYNPALQALRYLNLFRSLPMNPSGP